MIVFLDVNCKFSSLRESFLAGIYISKEDILNKLEGVELVLGASRINIDLEVPSSSVQGVITWGIR